MMIKISPNSLTIRKESCTNTELRFVTNYVDDIHTRDRVIVGYENNCISIHGDPAALYTTLYNLSFNYDIELV